MAVGEGGEVMGECINVDEREQCGVVLEKWWEEGASQRGKRERGLRWGGLFKAKGEFRVY